MSSKSKCLSESDVTRLTSSVLKDSISYLLYVCLQRNLGFMHQEQSAGTMRWALVSSKIGYVLFWQGRPGACGTLVARLVSKHWTLPLHRVTFFFFIFIPLYYRCFVFEMPSFNYDFHTNRPLLYLKKIFYVHSFFLIELYSVIFVSCILSESNLFLFLFSVCQIASFFCVLDRVSIPHIKQCLVRKI